MADNARFYMVGPEQPLTAPDSKQATKPWYTLLWQLYNAVTNGIPQTESSVPVGASPFTYTAAIRGQLSVTGGGGLTIEFTRDGTNFYAAGTSPCLIPICKGDRVRVTYAVAPALTFIPM